MGARREVAVADAGPAGRRRRAVERASEGRPAQRRVGRERRRRGGRLCTLGGPGRDGGIGRGGVRACVRGSGNENENGGDCGDPRERTPWLAEGSREHWSPRCRRTGEQAGARAASAEPLSCGPGLRSCSASGCAGETQIPRCPPPHAASCRKPAQHSLTGRSAECPAGPRAQGQKGCRRTPIGPATVATVIPRARRPRRAVDRDDPAVAGSSAPAALPRRRDRQDGYSRVVSVGTKPPVWVTMAADQAPRRGATRLGHGRRAASSRGPRVSCAAERCAAALGS
jgi:hypothetical protein